MKIALDMQVVQRHWHDGQAVKPLLHAVRELLSNRSDHDVFIMLDGGMKASAVALRNEFRDLLPPAAFRGWRAPRIADEEASSRVGQLIFDGCVAALDADVVVGAADPAPLLAQAEAAFQRIIDRAPALPQGRPRLAFVSPMPPQQTGIGEYSAGLLRELARYYDIEVVTEAAQVADDWVLANCKVRSAAWFADHAREYDRVLYHFGNSSYHEYMFPLLEQVPGVVVLHDFYLGNIQRDMQAQTSGSRAWYRALYESHGYAALREALLADGSREDAAWKYPANLRVINAARGVIVHSQFARGLASRWYGPELMQPWTVIPLLRSPAPHDDGARARAREALGLRDDDFLVCTFGVAGPLKLSSRLLDAWMQSGLADDPRCKLVFAGANDAGSYGDELQASMRDERCRNASVTGWLDANAYRQYLEAADVAVQLRAHTRGETSAAALDCLNHGIPTIVNMHGSLADFPPDAVHAIPDDFSTADLVAALESLRSDVERRRRLGDEARRYVAREHDPADCARMYADAIERAWRTRGMAADVLEAASAIVAPSSDEGREVARAIEYSLPRRSPVRELLVDVSAICRRDLRSGIQRVVRSVLMALIESPPAGFRIEPVYLSDEGGQWHARYARRYMLGLMDCPADALDDERAEPDAGDVFFGVDLSGGFVVAAEREELFLGWRAKGVGVSFVVHDLLPLQMPDKFPQEELLPFRQWLDVVARSDAVLGVSATVAGHFSQWRARNVADQPGPFVGHFHHGADIEHSAPTRGNPDNHKDIVSTLESRPTFLMVGTIEPRKGHAQVLAALEALWAEGLEWNLVIVGREGWMTEALAKRLREHPQLGRRLFWLQGISDEFLQRVYRLASCLVFASEGEGFGLPLIEAAQYGLPIVARDIPVFREVAGDHAFYFSGLSPRALARALREWTQLYRHAMHPRSDGMKWLTWRESTERIKQALGRAGLLPAQV